jgi:hypothetical protein
MDALGLFANQAAVAIELSRTQSNLTSLIAEALIALGGGANSLRQPMLERGRPPRAPASRGTRFLRLAAVGPRAGAVVCNPRD